LARGHMCSTSVEYIIYSAPSAVLPGGAWIRIESGGL